jgi:hypothetical protein
MGMATRNGNAAALDLQWNILAAGDWAIYRVPRLYGAKGATAGEKNSVRDIAPSFPCLCELVSCQSAHKI